jgi:hypothetical protein
MVDPRIADPRMADPRMAGRCMVGPCMVDPCIVGPSMVECRPTSRLAALGSQKKRRRFQRRSEYALYARADQPTWLSQRAEVCSRSYHCERCAVSTNVSLICRNLPSGGRLRLFFLPRTPKPTSGE